MKSSGTTARSAGREVLIQVLRKHGLDSHMLVVSRIFGGILLGPGNVARAFRDAGEGAVREAGATR